MGPAKHSTSLPLPKQATPKAGTSALLTVEQWEKTRSDMKAAREENGGIIAEEDMTLIFPNPNDIEPLIPFIGISEKAFYEMYEGKLKYPSISEASKINASNSRDRWEADVVEGTTLIAIKSTEYTAKLDELGAMWFDMRRMEAIRHQGVADGDRNASRAFLKKDYRALVNADLAKSPAFCETTPTPLSPTHSLNHARFQP